MKPVIATYEKVREIVDKRAHNVFIWPDENLKDDGTYITLAGKETITVEPLIIDVTTANALVTVHDALAPKNQNKFEDWIAKSRAHFARMVEFSWDMVSVK